MRDVMVELKHPRHAARRATRASRRQRCHAAGGTGEANGLRGAVFRALIARVTERKAFVEHGKFDASQEEMMEEFAKQLRLLDHEAVRTIDARLQRNDLPKDEREFLVEVLTEKLAAKRPST